MKTPQNNLVNGFGAAVAMLVAHLVRDNEPVPVEWMGFLSQWDESLIDQVIPEDDPIALAIRSLASINEPDAWLYDIKGPGSHTRYASVDKNERREGVSDGDWANRNVTPLTKALQPMSTSRLVPVEPTQSMGEQGVNAGARTTFEAEMIYRVMVDTAPRADGKNVPRASNEYGAMKRVPLEPTQRMSDQAVLAGAQSTYAGDMIYRAMVIAAPEGKST